MHEATFRKALGDAGLNPYLLEIANIRQQCAWVHSDNAAATAKAIDLARIVVAKATKDTPLEVSSIPGTQRALVVGGGIAGLQGSFGYCDLVQVTLVEKKPPLGEKWRS